MENAVTLWAKGLGRRGLVAGETVFAGDPRSPGTRQYIQSECQFKNYFCHLRPELDEIGHETEPEDNTKKVL